MSSVSPNIRSMADILSNFEVIPEPTGPILVATDTSPSSDSAFPIARALATSLNAEVRVISALRPGTMPMYAFDAMPYPMLLSPSIAEGRKKMVQQQLARLVPSATPWPVHVRVGEPMHEIVDDARTIAARVIVVGRGRHGALERLFGGESVLRLLQLGDTPVLAVEPGAEVLPHHVVICTDFSAFSVYAAQVALSLLAPGSLVRLVHVGPAISDADAALRTFAEGYTAEVERGFEMMRAYITPRGFHVETVLLRGNPSEALLEYLQSVQPDLVVTATHGYGFVKRAVLGSVTSSLVRSAPCSVLCVPGRARTISAARAYALSHQTTRLYHTDQLDAELNAFTTRNAGRRCSVELDHHDLGAQSLGHGMPLVGLSYDRHDASVVVMFGASSEHGEHITHRLQRCEAVHVISDATGRDQVLRFVHDGGQTLLILE
jgi:nucleotide-binding universal stress UspA family protein